MAPLRFPLEIVLAGVMALWTAGSLLCALPLRRIRRRLLGLNGGLWFAKWTVFGTAGDFSEVSAFTLEYRDRRGDEPVAWIEALGSRPWRWHAGLWQPRRRIADRIHRLGQDLARVTARRTPPATWLDERKTLLVNHLAAVHPAPDGTVREIRLRMRRSELGPPDATSPDAAPVVRVEESVLLQFTAAASRHDA